MDLFESHILVRVQINIEPKKNCNFVIFSYIIEELRIQEKL